MAKQIVEEVTGLLRLYDDGTVDRTFNGPLEVPVLPFNTPRDGITLHDIPGNPALRLYLPEQPPHPPPEDGATAAPSPLYPILLHFHGGGFCGTHPSWLIYYQFYSRLSRSLPAAILSVELPLAPENRLPAAADAAYRALLCLRSLAQGVQPTDPNLERLLSTADFTRVFLIGDSSGGNLVHDVAARAGREEEGFWGNLGLAGGILIHPGFVRSTRSRSELENQSASPLFTLEILDKFLALGLPEGATKDHPYTCPMGEAAPPLEGLRLPPFLVGVAELDLLRDRDMEYYEAMKAAGKEVEVVVSSGVGHCFYHNKILVDSDPTTAERTEELIGAVKSFIGRH